jgi:cytochrome b
MPSPHRVLVWDLPTRLFHWALVLLVLTSYVTGKVGGDAMTWHLWSGYAVLTLVLFRVVWGFLGGPHARFASFVKGPRAVLRYARTLFTTHAERHLGHNPLGGWSVVLLLASLATQAGTGLFASDDIATEGPLAARASAATVKLATRIHHYNEWVLVVLVTLHILAILYYAFVKREDLITAMVSGHKERPEPAAHSTNRVGLAVAIAAIAAAAVYLIVR